MDNQGKNACSLKWPQCASPNRVTLGTNLHMEEYDIIGNHITLPAESEIFLYLYSINRDLETKE